MTDIQITKTSSNFQREELRHFFGFKGGYLTELWQNIVQIRSRNGYEGIGMATQSVLYGDANVFASNSEGEGNALMYVVTSRALKILEGMTFENPIEIMDRIIPELYEEAKKLTRLEDLNINFLFNALVSVDNALWQLYASEKGIKTFHDMLPDIYKPALRFRNKKIAVMFQISYDMSMDDVRKAAQDGYFVFKIKTGFPGDPEEMLRKDIERLTEIHQTLKDLKTGQTETGTVYYTMDANGRYPDKKLLNVYLEHAKTIGAFSRILLYEEPFVEENDENVSDMGLLIAADESIHNEADALRKIALGYRAFVLKGIAKTLSQTLKIAKIAHDNGIPCLCSDLTVNPILIDWNKNVAASLPPFPGIGMGMMETNGDMNYKNWKEMKSRHPFPDAVWTNAMHGAFELNEHFYANAGGIFTTPDYYKSLFKHK